MTDQAIILKDEIIKAGNLPEHIAIIMDGNGRWAKQKGLIRVAGHKEGVQSVKEVVKAAVEIGIKYLTLYTFSMENWRRPKIEVSALMQLLVRTLRKEVDDLQKNDVRLAAMGHIGDLPANVRRELAEASEKTKDNSGLVLNIALSYSGRTEILDAVKKISMDSKNGKLKPENIDDKIFNSYLYTSSMPDPDLMIRTSGEFRISNFLLWQLAYTEIYVTDTYWPDFRKVEFFKAILNYLQRERRFGKTSRQLEKK